MQASKHTTSEDREPEQDFFIDVLLLMLRPVDNFTEGTPYITSHNISFATLYIILTNI